MSNLWVGILGWRLNSLDSFLFIFLRHAFFGAAYLAGRSWDGFCAAVYTAAG
jgi:hypothetical protein